MVIRVVMRVVRGWSGGGQGVVMRAVRGWSGGGQGVVMRGCNTGLLLCVSLPV